MHFAGKEYGEAGWPQAGWDPGSSLGFDFNPGSRRNGSTKPGPEPEPEPESESEPQIGVSDSDVSDSDVSDSQSYSDSERERQIQAASLEPACAPDPTGQPSLEPGHEAEAARVPKRVSEPEPETKCQIEHKPEPEIELEVKSRTQEATDTQDPGSPVHLAAQPTAQLADDKLAHVHSPAPTPSPGAPSAPPCDPPPPPAHSYLHYAYFLVLRRV